jgi:dTDP-4-amino-4,6-dideoxygalactose transaminase
LKDLVSLRDFIHWLNVDTKAQTSRPPCKDEKRMIPFIDLNTQRARLQPGLDDAIAKVIAEGRYIFGPEVTELETRLCEFGQANHALTCANGTDAIALPLMAWGLKPGDAVFVPSFTFASTAEVVPWLGATPVFVDIDPDTYCMDPESLEAAIKWAIAEPGLNPHSVIAVDLFGQPADYPAIAALCDTHNLKLIADSAQGFGCTLNDKHPVHWADITTISFYPAKPLGCYGDGGAVLTKSDEDQHLMKSLRNHGEGEARYSYARIGMNSRLDTIQAAILLEKLDIFADEIVARNRAAEAYADGFTDVVKTPIVIGGGISNWAQYTVEHHDRDAARAHLADRGVPTAIYYPIPLHKQSPYASYPRSPGGMNVTEAVAERVFSLPMDAYLEGERLAQVIDAVNSLA